MKNTYFLMFLASVLLSLSLPMANASWRVFYQTSGYGTTWYLKLANGGTIPSQIPVGLANNPVYLTNISQFEQSHQFVLEFRPFNASGDLNLLSNWSIITTFEPSSSTYILPASLFQGSGSYRIADPEWHTQDNSTTIILYNSSTLPREIANTTNANGLQGIPSTANTSNLLNSSLLLWAAIIILLVLIIILFAMVLKRPTF